MLAVKGKSTQELAVLFADRKGVFTPRIERRKEKEKKKKKKKKKEKKVIKKSENSGDEPLGFEPFFEACASEVECGPLARFLE